MGTIQSVSLYAAQSGRHPRPTVKPNAIVASLMSPTLRGIGTIGDSVSKVGHIVKGRWGKGMATTSKDKHEPDALAIYVRAAGGSV